MNLDERDLWKPLTDANPAAVARVCRRHDWLSTPNQPLIDRTWCRRCGKVRDEARAKTGRNNRKRGNAEELTVARKLGGEKVGPLGLPWDVTVPGYLRAQVKKLARWPSLGAVLVWLDAIPRDPEMRAVVIVGTGRGARRLIVMDFDEYCERHGAVKGGTET